MKIPFCKGMYTAYSKAQNEQKCINWYPELVGDGENNYNHVLYPCPGYKPSITSSGRPRGYHLFNKTTPYIVKGTSLYRQDPGGTLSSSLGTVAESSPGWVSMSDDGTTITITTGENGYTYNTSSGTFAEITDADFTKSNRFNSYYKGYTVYSGAVNSQQYQVSGAFDSDSIDALDFASAEAAPDIIQCHVVYNDLIYFFGSDGIEVAGPSGLSFPIAAVAGGYIERGCIAPYSVQKLDGQLFWLGDDLNVYRIEGYQPFSITPPGIAEKILEAANPELAQAYTYIKGGHAFYCLNFEEFTLVYDVATQKWHERSSWREESVSYVNGYSFDNNFSEIASDGDSLAIDRSTGYLLCYDGATATVYVLNPDTGTEIDSFVLAEAVGNDGYIAAYGGNLYFNTVDSPYRIYKYTGISNTVSTSITLAANKRGIAFDADGNLLVADFSADTVTKYSGFSTTVLSSIDISGIEGNVTDIDVDPVTGNTVITGITEDVYILTGFTNTVETSFDVPGSLAGTVAAGLAISQTGKMYIYNSGEGEIYYSGATGLLYSSVPAHEKCKCTHVYRAYGLYWALHDDGNIYELDDEYFYEGSSGVIVRDRITEDFSDGNRRIRQPELWLKFETGVGPGDNSTPYATLRISNDLGRTWGNELQRSMGKKGEYSARVIWRRLGSFYRRRYWLRVSAPVKAVVLDAGGEFI